MGIYLTNSQGASMPDPHDLGPGLDLDTIFTTLSLAGHSCVPNAQYESLMQDACMSGLASY